MNPAGVDSSAEFDLPDKRSLFLRSSPHPALPDEDGRADYPQHRPAAVPASATHEQGAATTSMDGTTRAPSTRAMGDNANNTAEAETGGAGTGGRWYGDGSHFSRTDVGGVRGRRVGGGGGGENGGDRREGAAVASSVAPAAAVARGTDDVKREGTPERRRGATTVAAEGGGGGSGEQQQGIDPSGRGNDGDGGGAEPQQAPPTETDKAVAPGGGDRMDVGEAEDGDEEEDDREPKPPDDAKANSMSFPIFCRRLDVLWKQRRVTNGGKKATTEKKLEYLLPRKLRRHLGDSSSLFPMLRLVLPELDFARPHFGMRDKTIATTWGSAMGLNRRGAATAKLMHYTDPAKAGPTAAGDLSVALMEVMSERYGAAGSKLTIGKVNELLDELHLMKRGGGEDDNGEGDAGGVKKAADEDEGARKPGAAMANPYRTPTPQMAATKARASLQARRVQWVEKLLALHLSPLEHKWIVRILLQKMEIGFSGDTILKYYHPWAHDMYNANRNLRTVCTALSDPEWVRWKKEKMEEHQRAVREQLDRAYLPRSSEPAVLGNTISVMVANRTSFDQALEQMGSRHKSRAESLPAEDDDGGGGGGAVGLSSLALKFPAFVCEAKLDGERIIAHVRRGGVVTLQTRRARWYSRLYSPVIGPAIRRALGGRDVDVILDGEILAWDGVRKEYVPFGGNQTIAKARRDWLKRHGRLDERDLNLHAGEDDGINVVSVAVAEYYADKQGGGRKGRGEAEEESGADCWMKFVLFDILYLDGPDAKGLIEQTGSLYKSSLVPDLKKVRGSIIDLDGYHRKTILYNLIHPQEDEVDIVESVVITPDGRSVNARDYFCPKQTSEWGYSPAMLDSIDNALHGTVPNLAEIDERRRMGRTDREIDEERARGVDGFFTKVVETECQEGILFKDLAAPYYLGEQSRGLGYWRKLKQDYHNESHASDVDVIVLGGFFAGGLRSAGLLNHFLVGCADRQPDGSTLYIPLTKVSGQTTRQENLEGLLDRTGYRKETETSTVEYGKWFKERSHGTSLPDFISHRSYQRSMDGDDHGWKFDRTKTYPDLWIRPEDSFVLTLNAGEIVTSDSFAAGVTLRFPRIHRIRLEGFDGGPKAAEEVETVSWLHEKYFERQAQSRGLGGEGRADDGADSSRDDDATADCRFLTAEQRKKKTSRKRRANADAPAVASASRIVRNVSEETNALHGFTFTVLGGTYGLDEHNLDAEEARQGGWLSEALAVQKRQHVVDFIFRHGGNCVLTGNTSVNFIIGGSVDDARVSTYKKALSVVSLENTSDKTKKAAYLRELSKVRGVVKWTSLLAMVHKWLVQVKMVKVENDSLDANASTNIKDGFPSLARLRRHDYLVLSKLEEERLGLTEDEFGNHLWENSDLVTLKRALEEIGRRKCNSKHSQPSGMEEGKRQKLSLPSSSGNMFGTKTPWQYTAISCLEEDEQWIMAGKRQILWPWRLTLDSTKRTVCGGERRYDTARVVVYPDLFLDSFGLRIEREANEEVVSGRDSARWDKLAHDFRTESISAVLPLVKAMGAQVTPHFHDGVTHVLCDMDDHDTIEWRKSLPSNVLSSKLLYAKLSELSDLAHRGENEWKKVQLVTPRWVKEKWKQTETRG